MLFKKGVSDEKLRRSIISRLQMAERFADRNFTITSAFREGDDGAHGDGSAVDIRCSSSTDRYAIVKALTDAGFRRIGIYDRHIHADLSLTRPQSVMWTGRSK